MWGRFLKQGAGSIWSLCFLTVLMVSTGFVGDTELQLLACVLFQLVVHIYIEGGGRVWKILDNLNKTVEINLKKSF